MAHSGGGGSHGGGSHGGSHHGGGSSGVNKSKSYFQGSYYHSYVDRRGRNRTYYSSQSRIARPSKVGVVLFGIFMVPFLLFAFIISINDAVQRPVRLNDTTPDAERVIDRQHCFNAKEETELSKVLEEYYDQTGINAVVYTVPNTKWNTHYSSLQTFAMEQYYQMFDDEKHYLVVFSNETLEDGWQDWSFETIVGDDTTKVLGTIKENYMTERLQSNLWSYEHEPEAAFAQSFRELMEYSKTTHVDWNNIFVAIIVVGIYVTVYFVMIHEYRKQADEYRYVQEHPEAIKNPLNYHLQCPNCSAPNTHLEDSCEYCGSVLRKNGTSISIQNKD